MASADPRKCILCEKIYTDPLMLKCGHTFCSVCINHVLDMQEESGEHWCPYCRKRFRGRPGPDRNITLCDKVEHCPLIQPHPETKTFCRYCIEGPLKAFPHDEASLSMDHLRVHGKSSERVLSDPTTASENRKCSTHKELLTYFCAKDACCICVYCRSSGEHRGHKVETLHEASEKKKKKMLNVLQNLITRRNEIERRVWEGQKKVDKKASFEKTVDDLFGDIERRLKDLEKTILTEISMQDKHPSHSDILYQLEIKKELSRKISCLEELCNTTDPLTVLQEPDPGDLTEEGCNEDSERQDEELHDGVDLDVGGISHILRQGLSDIIRGVTGGVYIPDPADILLDVNTAYYNLCISEDRKTVSRSDTNLNYPQTAERFQNYPQVLSSQSFSSGYHYWEVDGMGSPKWSVGMCYPNIERRGPLSLIGQGKKSWCCHKKGGQCFLIHDRKVITLAGISSSRVRIYLDYEAGWISFHDLGQPVRHLHTFTTTFTEPLHAALGVGGRGSITISGGHMKIP